MARKINNYPGETPATPHRPALTCKNVAGAGDETRLCFRISSHEMLRVFHTCPLASIGVVGDRYSVGYSPPGLIAG